LGEVLVGTATSDDASVIRIAPGVLIVQTVDFFTPVVDDPYLFGAIAAANAVSDIYAMGGTPVSGLAIAGFPTDRLPLEVLQEILRGGAEKAAEAGFSIAGGHTIIDDVPKYGLAVTGVIAEENIIRNSTARAGDALYLTKPIGNGILVCAHRAFQSRRWFRRGGPDLCEAIRWMSALSAAASRIMVEVGVSAATDVTGYGLLGHLREMCQGAGVGAEIRVADVPILEGAREWLARGFRPAGTMRNVATVRSNVRGAYTEDDLVLLADAQTSGGLLIAVPEDRMDRFEQRFAESGLFCAKIGRVAGDAGQMTLMK
jgi:selenide,water dikinase